MADLVKPAADDVKADAATKTPEAVKPSEKKGDELHPVAVQQLAKVAQADDTIVGMKRAQNASDAVNNVPFSVYLSQQGLAEHHVHGFAKHVEKELGAHTHKSHAEWKKLHSAFNQREVK